MSVIALVQGYWSVRIRMYVYVYIRHTLIAWVLFLRSHHQATSHVVQVRPGGDQCVTKIVRELK